MMLRPLVAATLALVAACTRASRGVEVFEVVASSRASAPVGRAQQDARVLVRRATIDVEVEEVARAVERATAVARAFDGYVEHVMTNETKSAYLRLRIPSRQLDAAIDSLARLGKVTGRSLSEEDVTAQSVDLEARVASYRAARDKLRDLLARAATVADAVAAQGELTRVQAELDSLEGQLKMIQSSVAQSELTVTLNRRRILGPLGIVASGLATLIGKLFVWR